MESVKHLVIFEGLDGSGKSTQMALLKNTLLKRNIPFVSGHFPDYTSNTGKIITSYLDGSLLGDDPSNINPYTVHMMYALDRSINFQKKYQTYYERGDWVLFDRYTTSSLIYQCASFSTIPEKEAFIDYVCDLEFIKIALPHPTDVIYFDIDPLVAEGRMQNRIANPGVSHENDIHESHLSFQQKVRETALFVAQYLHWSVIPVLEKGNYRSIEEIHQDTMKILQRTRKN